MKLAKSLLLGAAAGLAAVSGASAADLGVKKPTPVEYVRVCPAYGNGYFFIPGTQTCLAIGGRVRAEYRYIQPRGRNDNTQSGFRGQARLNVDTRTQTEIGVLRAFFRIEVARRTGSLRSGTQARLANAFESTADPLTSGIGGKAQNFVTVDKAFIQFSGLGGVITAGRVQSFFDFYAHDLEWFGGTAGSDLGSTTAFAYTATFGGGFSATLAMEDPIERRGQGGVLSRTQFAGLATIPGFVPIVGVPGSNGVFGNGFQIGYGNSRLPDFVGALQYDAAFGSLKLTAAVHEVNFASAGTFGNVGGGVGGTGASINGINSSIVPDAEYGYAVQAGAKINLPFIAAGDVLWLQASYSEGATSYTGPNNYIGFGNPLIGTPSTGGTGLGTAFLGDAVVDVNGRARLARTFAATGAFLHYWTPQLRQGVFGSYSRTEIGRASTIGFIAANPALGIAANSNPIFPNFSQYFIGSNLIYSPVRGLDIGVEVGYNNFDFRQRVVDQNRFGRTIKSDDQVYVQARVQRDF